MFQNIGEMVVLFWRTLLALPLAWRQRQKVFEQFFEIGNASLLMVCILSFFIGGAIAVALPLLVIFAVLVGWLGGAFVCFANNRIEMSFAAFYSALRDVVQLKDVANGVFKSFVFALIIAVVSCHQGLVTRGGPRGIGRSVTKAVVNSIVLIVISDYVLTRILLS